MEMVLSVSVEETGRPTRPQPLIRSRCNLARTFTSGYGLASSPPPMGAASYHLAIIVQLRILVSPTVPSLRCG